METAQIKKELTITRVLNAPRDIVFKAWTDPKMIAAWWGPGGFTAPVCNWDAKPGGDIYIEMKGPDGTVYPMNGTFREIEEPSRIVFTSCALDKDGKALFEVLNSIDLIEKNGKTELTLNARVSKITAEAEPYIAGMNEGWNQSIDRLDETVGKIKNTPFMIERTYNAPIAMVWKAISDRDEMRKWYFDLAEFKTEVGFEFQFKAGKDDKPYLHLCKVTDVIPGKKLAYSWRYDGYEGISIVTFELFEEGKNQTRLKLTHEGLETFPLSNPDFGRHNFVKGWTQIIGTSVKDFVEKQQP